MNFDINHCDDVFAEVTGVQTLDRWCQNKKREVGTSCEIERGNPHTNDKGIMVGSTGISQLKAECGENTEQFEIVQDVGYSSETSAHFSNDEPLECSGHNLSSDLKQPLCHTKGAAALHDVDHSSHTDGILNTKANAHSVVNTLSPDKYPAFNLKGWQLLSNEDLLSKLRPKNFSTTPNSFYKMTSIDSDAYEDVADTTLEKDFENEISQNLEIKTSHCDKVKLNTFTKISHSSSLVAVDVSTSKSPLKNMPNPDINSPCNKYRSSNYISGLANASVKLGKRSQKVSQKPIKESLQYTENTKRSARVQEWLNTCQTGEEIILTTSPEHNDQGKLELSKKLFVDSSCDASGEYTTTESDCDRSTASDDINNSLSFTRSFTGSVETVVPISVEEANLANDDCAVNTDPSANVRLRKKRQNRERPWSAIEVHQMLHSPSHFSHSTSEGAINTLPCTPQSSRNTFSGSKKFCLESAKSLLPFISYSSGDKHRRRSHSRGSFRSTRHCSETGSDGCLTFKRRLCFSTSKPSSLDNSQHSASATFEQSPSAFTSASDGTNEVLHSSSSAHQLSNKSSVSESSKRSTRSHRKRNSKTAIREVSRKEHNGSEESAPEKRSINSSCIQVSVSTTNYDKTTVNGEDQSSVSDQVWDEYQDPPYLSEPYSEQTADEDQVRKLLNFGDDYRTLLGSHSDASSIIAQSRFQRSPNNKSRKKSCVLSFRGSESRTDPFDYCSDSDTEDFLSMLSTSNSALTYLSGVYNDLKSDLAEQSSSFSSELADIVATCQMNLRHLYVVQNELYVKQDKIHYTVEDFSKLQEVIEKWEVLQAKLLNMPHNETRASTENLEAEVFDVCDVMATLKEKLNFIGNIAVKALDSFSELKALDSKITKLQAGLATLQEIKDAVLSVNARIVRLAAESGGANISPLKDNATKLYRQWEDVYELNGSQLTKLLALQSRWKNSEEKDIPKEVETVVQWHQVQAGDPMPKTVVSEESRLPKAGAEVLIPGHHDSVVEMDVIQLPSASEKCRITNVDEHSILELPLLHLHPPALKFQTTGHKRCCAHSGVTDSSNKSSALPRSKKTRSRLWRTIRAAIPIQVALVMLYCMACLLEPHCCDNLNNFNFSVWPQLRYVRGPPPV